MRAWLLPEYIEDILPVEARRIERLRRLMLDVFATHGYELVMPPMLEYLESLLTGTGHDLDLQTFKLVDQLSGRTLGVRADITPQVARIDAHLLDRKGVTRLCYSGSVLRTLPDGMNRTREPLQIGAEIYGHAGIESDIEIQRLMLSALELAKIGNVFLDVGHVGIFRSLMGQGRVQRGLEADLFRAVQSKDLPGIRGLVKSLPRPVKLALEALPELYGGVDVLTRGRKVLPATAEITQALRDLRSLSTGVGEDARIRCFDLGELRGYHYHSGIVFAAYSESRPNALAQGGRYDEVGKAFGRARPATGFSMDLRELAALGEGGVSEQGVLAPYRPNDERLQKKIADLRRTGAVVIVDLPGHADARDELNCDQRLVQQKGRWSVEMRQRKAGKR